MSFLKNEGRIFRPFFVREHIVSIFFSHNHGAFESFLKKMRKVSLVSLEVSRYDKGDEV